MWQHTAETLLSLLDATRLSPGARDCLATAPWVSLVLRYALLAAPLAMEARRCCVRLLRALLPKVSFLLYRYILRESCSQFDSLPLTSLTISGRSRRSALRITRWSL